MPQTKVSVVKHFYRGISVPASVARQTIATIENSGLAPGEGKQLIALGFKGATEDLFLRERLSTTDTRLPLEEIPPQICACGELSGATYYAWHHNRTDKDDTPIIIEFYAHLDNVVIDGRDFLYTVFQLGDPPRARGTLVTAFGPRILRYAERAWSEPDQGTRVALCDLAAQDREIIEAHHANELILGGRNGTVFRNAFQIALPLPSSAIKHAFVPEPTPIPPRPQVHFSDLLLPSHRRPQ